MRDVTCRHNGVKSCCGDRSDHLTAKKVLDQASAVHGDMFNPTYKTTGAQQASMANARAANRAGRPALQ